MGLLAAYSIKSAILLSLLMAIYVLTLGRQKAPTMRRAVLLCICIASLLLPAFYIFRLHGDNLERTVPITSPLPTLTVSEIYTPIIFKAIAGIISVGMCIATAASIIGIARILNLRTRTVYMKGHKLKIMTEGNSSPFCFCGSIYLSEKDSSQLPEMILTHENSHIRHRHFIDLLIGRILLIMQWWNPLAWLFVREVKQVHEYQADNDVLDTGYDAKEYQYLLLNRAIGDTGYSLASGFKHSELKNRLKMINRENSGRRKSAALITVFSAALSSYALSTSPLVGYVNDKFTAISLASYINNEPQEKTTVTLDGKPHVIIDGTPIPYESMSDIDPNSIKSISVWKDKPEYPYGVIEIETKPETGIRNTESPHETEETRAVSYGTIKKPQ